MADRFDPKNMTASDKELLRSGLDVDGDGKITEKDIIDIAALDRNSDSITNNDMANALKRRTLTGGTATTALGKNDEFRAKISAVINGTPTARYEVSTADMIKKLTEAGLYDGEPSNQGKPNDVATRKLPEKPLKAAIGLFDMDGNKSVSMDDLKKISSDGNNISRDDMVKLVDEKIKLIPEKGRAQARETILKFVDDELLKGGAPISLDQMRTQLEAFGVMQGSNGAPQARLEGEALKRAQRLFDLVGEPQGTKPDGKFSQAAFDAIAGADGKINTAELRDAVIAATPKPKNRQQAANMEKGLVALDEFMKTQLFSEKTEMTKQEFSDRLRSLGIEGGIEGIPDGRPNAPAGPRPFGSRNR